MKLYKIRDWDRLYENNRSRAVEELSWVKIPNRHDGENFSGIMMHKEGSKIFSAFIIMVEIASRCVPRGTLIRTNGAPHDVTSMSVKCRAPAVWFEIALPYLENFTDWLEVVEMPNTCKTDTQLTSETSPGCQAGDEERKKERIESPPSSGGEHQAFINGWTENFKAAFGFDYKVEGGRDGKAVKDILRLGILRIDLLEIAKQAWKRNQEDKFASACKQAATIHGFAASLNRIRVELKNGNNQTHGASGSKGFDRNKGTLNEGKAARYDLKKIQADRALRNTGQPELGTNA